MSVHPALGLLAAYLLGSIPAAYLAGRARGVDLRAHGSGNLGATNALRVLGWKVGVPVFLFDALKGFAPAFWFPALFDAPGHWAMAYGVAAIVGHVKPVFLLGSGGGGGKGVATAAGVFLGLAPIATSVALLTFAAVVAATGYVSLGSLTAAVALVIAMGVTLSVRAPVFALGALVCGFVFWSHRANIGRLRRGEEHSFRRKRTVSAQPAEAPEVRR